MMLVRFKVLITFITIFFISSFKHQTSNKEILEGDLFFQHISMLSLYGASDEQFNQLEKEMDSVLASGKAKPYELELYQHFDRLRGKGLLRSPYVFLRVEPDSIMPIYFSEGQYDKVKNYQLNELIKSHQKVSLKLLVEQHDKRIYYCDSIVSVKKVKGQTFPVLKGIENL